MSVAVAHELVELEHDLARAVSEHDVDRLEELLADEFTLQGAAGQLDREAFLLAAAGPYEIDDFVEAMQAIAREAADSPEVLKEAPHGRPVRRLDEVRAAKQPVVRYAFDEPAVV